MFFRYKVRFGESCFQSVLEGKRLTRLKGNKHFSTMEYFYKTERKATFSRRKIP